MCVCKFVYIYSYANENVFPCIHSNFLAYTHSYLHTKVHIDIL